MAAIFSLAQETPIICYLISNSLRAFQDNKSGNCDQLNIAFFAWSLVFLWVTLLTKNALSTLDNNLMQKVKLYELLLCSWGILLLAKQAFGQNWLGNFPTQNFFMRIGANGPNYSISLRGAADLVHEPISFCQRADIMHIALVIMSPFVPHFFFCSCFIIQWVWWMKKR